MKTDTTYNGHKDWQHWNVALWLGNDEPLYRMAMSMLQYHKTPGRAAEAMMDALPLKTPDGAEYTVETVTAAIRYFKD